MLGHALPGSRARRAPVAPRFPATAAELEKKGIQDDQLDYALKALKRLAPAPVQLAKTASR